MMIKETIFSLKNGKYENQIFLQMVVMVTVPLIIMGVIAYYIYFTGEVQQNRQQLEAYCENVCMEYDNVLSSVKEYYMDATRNDDFQWLAGQRFLPYSQQSRVVSAQELLRGNYFLMKYIRNYHFINVKDDWCLNSYGMFPYSMARNREEVDLFLEEQKENPLSVYWLNHRDQASPYQDNAKESRVVDLSQELFVLKEQDVNGEISYILVVQLEPLELKRIQERNDSRGFELLVLSDGKELVSSSQEFSQAYEGYMEKGKNGGAAYNGISYEIYVSSFAANRLTVVAGYDKSRARQEGAVFIWVSVVFALTLAAAIGGIRYLALRFSEPVMNLQRLVDKKNVQIKELFVSNLIKGKAGVTDQRIQELLKNMEVEPWPIYRMMAVVLKGQSVKTQGREPETARRILGELPDTIRELIFVTPVYLDQSIFFVIGGTEEVPLEKKTAVLYKMVKDYVWEHCQDVIAAGISRPMNRLESMSRAYEECREALHNRQNSTREHSTLVLYDDYSLKDHSRNVYDIVVESELVNAVENGNQEEAGRLLELILERMERREVAGIERNIYVTRLTMAMMAVLQNNGIPLDQVFDIEKYGDFMRAGQIYDRKKLTDFMKEELLCPLSDIMRKHQPVSDTEVTKQVLKLIKESQGTISLGECAQRLNYHPNHIGKLLKRDTGKTFSDLINDERMELAKYLLLTTDYSVAEIAGKLRYNNVQNFIRFFKSNAQITPAAYRKAHR